MLEQMKVKKWGGENAAEFKDSPQNIVDDYDRGIKQAIVVSAIRSPDFNTTDNLIDLGNILSSGFKNLSEIISKINMIRDFHLNIVDEKISGDTKNIKNIIIKMFENLLSDIALWGSSGDKIFPIKENDYTINTRNGNLSIIGFGEILSAFIQEVLINNLGIEGLEAQVLNFDGITEGLEEKLDESELFLILSKEISNRVSLIINKNKVAILQGYIPGFKNGIENAIGRGYTDATAAMTAVGLSNSFNVILEIQKSVLGILSADPRIVKTNTKLIEQIDYLTAKEITGARGAQAKLLHSQVLRKELQESDIKVRLFNPFSGSEGTLISKNKNTQINGVEYIGGRKNIIVFSVSSGKMSGTGVLSSIFNIVKKYTPVDIVSTSETEVSFTIDLSFCKEKLEKMSLEIREVLDIKEDGDENFVKYKENIALIFCIGQNFSGNKGLLGKVALALAKGNIDIEMVSQGIMQRAMVFGIDDSRMEDAIQLLHNELI